MMLVFCIAMLVLMFLLPFAPAYYEYYRKRDAEPLSIKMDYVRNLHFFSESFKQKFNESLTITNGIAGLHDFKLSRNEKVETIETATIADDTVEPNVYYVKKNLNTGNRVKFSKEVYVKGNVKLGEENQIRALAAEGDIHLGCGTKVIRWIDASGSVRADESSNLGISVSCRKELLVSPACSFRRLYGFPVEAVTAGGAEKRTVTEIAAHSDLKEIPVFEEAGKERDCYKIPHNARENRSIITYESLVVEEQCLIFGHIKTYGNLMIGENVLVSGNLFAEGTIRLGAGSRVLGTVFSQERIFVGPGVVIGSPDTIKSVIGKKGVTMEEGAKVFGYIMTEGEGIVA